MVGRLKGLIISATGLVLMVLGIGMWQSPEMDWEGFVGALASIAGEIGRLSQDPFAVIGIVVLIIGVFVLLGGLKRMIRG